MSTGPTGPTCRDHARLMSPNSRRERDSVEGLLREVGELRAENARLRGLLGFDDRPREGHAEAWTPTLLTEPPTQPVVDNSSPWEDKLGLFRSLFGGRTDVYAHRWESASSGRSGWAPATNGRWSKGRPPKDHLPLADEVFVAHLRGEQTKTSTVTT